MVQGKHLIHINNLEFIIFAVNISIAWCKTVTFISHAFKLNLDCKEKYRSKILKISGLQSLFLVRYFTSFLIPSRYILDFF